MKTLELDDQVHIWLEITKVVKKMQLYIVMISAWSGPWATYEDRVNDTKIHGPLRVKLAKILAPILDDLKLDWFLESGTLLGAWRDNTMIPHDDDFDLGLCVANDDILEQGGMNALLISLRDSIQSALPQPYRVRIVSSYVKKVEIYDSEQGKYQLSKEYDFHNVTVDLSILITDGVKICHTHHDNKDFTLEHSELLPTTNMEYEGGIYPVPAETHTFLKNMYGYLGPNATFNQCTKLYDAPA